MCSYGYLRQRASEPLEVGRVVQKKSAVDASNVPFAIKRQIRIAWSLSAW